MMTSHSVGSSEEAKFKGVRKRKWGKWVSEVRLPNSRERIWLGSYDSPDKAARAFDAAAFCLRGRRARLNFPDNPPAAPTARSLTYQQIQELAAMHAHSVETTVVTTAATIATAPDATKTEVAMPANNSPSEEMSATATMIDWSFVDMMNEGFHPRIDEFGYDHFMTLPPLLSPTVGPSDWMGEDGMGGVGTSSILWNF